jgi:hypothetical protein
MRQPWWIPVAALLGTALSATLAGADVTVRAHTTTNGFGLSTSASTVTWIKGLRMRQDATIREQTLTTLIDLDLARYVALDRSSRTASVFDMRPYAARLASAANTPVVTLRATGRTERVAGESCAEFEISATAISAGGSPDSRLETRGVAWVAADSAAREDWSAFHGAVVDKGLFFTDPRVVDVDPLRVRVIAAVYAGIARRGIPCSVRVELERRGAVAPGANPDAAGRTIIEMTVTEMIAAPLDEDLFAVPGDFTTVRR